MKAKHHTNFLPDRVFSYFQKEWKVLLAVTISGLIYNIGLLAGPWFEGKMTGCLVDILKGADQFSDMLVLVLGYVTAIAMPPASKPVIIPSTKNGIRIKELVAPTYFMI